MAAAVALALGRRQVLSSLVIAATMAVKVRAAFVMPFLAIPAAADWGVPPGGQHGVGAVEGSHRRLRRSTHRMFTARAITRVARINEISDSEIIVSFAHLRMADTSVGPKAVAVLKDSAR